MTIAAAATGLLYEMYRPVVSATVADLVRAADRPRAYGLIYWAVNVGASVASLLGGLIATRSYRALFVADAATTVLFGVILWAALPETRPPRSSAQAAPELEVQRAPFSGIVSFSRSARSPWRFRSSFSIVRRIADRRARARNFRIRLWRPDRAERRADCVASAPRR